MPLPISCTQPPPEPSARHGQLARERQQVLTKPPGSLGILEQVAIELAALQSCESPTLEQVHIAVFAGDHGVCEEGISAFPQAVTAQMIANFAGGGAAISVLARELDAQLEVINLGTVGEVPELSGVLHQVIAPTTENFAKTKALTGDQLEKALNAGDQAAQRAADNQARLFIGGDMGIGNTTSAAALASALLGHPSQALVGPGTGLDENGVSHKARVVQTALERHGDNREPLSVLTSLGGFEIAGLTGAILGCAARRIPVLVDGFIVSVAALVATEIQPGVRNWLLFSHRSAEPGHQSVLEALNAQPLLNLGMRLGEGSGAAVAVPLLRTACALHNQMATFADAGVSDKSGA
ncbi:MAG: nicotinate-nucleotide--dimethylbenzimidazole phosphoribosyltransferase [Alteromonadaceae bacterium]|nr:nicotinate-nucleotide--dimethylbenzimidazole phosphoribosyltransferase [Alteromonadaceae bacterium]